MTFLGTYAIYLPMHYLGILGVPRRYYAYSDSTDFIARVVHTRQRGDHDRGARRRGGAAGVPRSTSCGQPAQGQAGIRANPWGATTLEWQTPDTPPKHGNWGPKLPVVYRWAYDYSVPGAPQDFIPQNEPPGDPRAGNAPAGRDHGVHH